MSIDTPFLIPTFLYKQVHLFYGASHWLAILDRHFHRYA